MRCVIVAECATNWGGDRMLMLDMIHAAADAGADIAKFQSYQVKYLRRDDPQYEWFALNELSDADHELIVRTCETVGIQALFTAFTEPDLARLRKLGQTRVKIGSGEGRSGLVPLAIKYFTNVYATTPWGWMNYDVELEASESVAAASVQWLATVPIYPAPVECYAQIPLRFAWGYSCHSEGLDIAKIAMLNGAPVIEKHFALPNRGRQQVWNMLPADLRELRRWSEVCAQATRGTKFEGRWVA